MRIIFDCCLSIFFFKQKTAYEMRISDWSSDVCSSDLTTSCGSCPTRPRPPSGVATTPTWIRFDDAYPHPPPACPCPRHGHHGPRRLGTGNSRSAGRVRHRASPARRERARAGCQTRQQLHRQRHPRSEEHTSELQSLMRISYAVFCLKKKTQNNNNCTVKHQTIKQ